MGRPAAVVRSRMAPARRALHQIHLCVLLWAFTAILGRLMSLSAAQIVAWRLLLVFALLALLPRVWRALRGIPGPMLARYAGIGVVVAAHWLAFYGAIKLSNASVATICLAVAPVAITLFEPLIHGARIRGRDLALGIAVVPGVRVDRRGVFPDGMTARAWVGLVAAVLGAAFMSLNKRWGGEQDALAVTAVEMGAGLAFVLALLPWLPGGGDAAAPRPARPAAAAGAGHRLHDPAVRAVAGGAARGVGVHDAARDQPRADLRDRDRGGCCWASRASCRRRSTWARRSSSPRCWPRAGSAPGPAPRPRPPRSERPRRHSSFCRWMPGGAKPSPS